MLTTPQPQSPTPDLDAAFVEAWKHDTAVYRFARANGFSAADAESIVQDTFVEFWKSLQRGYEVREPKALLLHICRRKQQERWRRAERSESVEDMPLAEEPPQQAWGVWRDVQSVLGRLDPRSREVLVLWHIGGLKYRDIATELGVPLGTVQSRVARARAAFRALWEAEP